MSEYIVKGAVPNHTVLVEDEREVIWHMTHLPVREEVVRCRDCKHMSKNGKQCMYFSAYEPIAGGDEYAVMHAEVESDGFCAWGERRA